MSALVRKELRLLAPAWLAALAASTAPLWSGRAIGFAGAAFGAGILCLALAPFGREISCGTMGLLLVQPEDRRRFLKIKVGLAALALLSVWAMMLVSLWLSQPENPPPEGLDLMWGMALVVFVGGLWTTLLLRDVATAFFATVLASVALWLGVLFLAQSESLDVSSPILVVVLGAYIVAGFWFARRLFLRAQDLPWTGGQVALPKMSGLPFRLPSFAFSRRSGPWAALFEKELRLQEISIFLIPCLALLHAADLLARGLAPRWYEKTGFFPWLWVLWFIVPFMIGCVAVAEERRLNTLEGLLCLAVRKRNPFALKLLVALALGVLFGAVVPFGLEHLGLMAGVKTDVAGFPSLLVMAALITGISFLASTMARGMLQAFTAALGITLIAGLAYNFCARFRFAGEFAGSFGLFTMLLKPAMLVTFFWLAFRNYKCLQTGWAMWFGNFARGAVVFAAVGLATAAVYQRPWELIMRLEPVHGPPRLSGAGLGKMGDARENLFILLPDGRLWIGEKGRPSWEVTSGKFAPGSNWTDLAVQRDVGAIALKSDGTLWDVSDLARIRQRGGDSDWKTIAYGGPVSWGVKRDGTLWRLPDKWNATFPVRIGDATDWKSLFPMPYGDPICIKRDGTAWQPGVVINSRGHIRRGSVYLSGVGAILSYDVIPRKPWNARNWTSLAGYARPNLGVRSDGSLWAADFIPFAIFGEPRVLNGDGGVRRIGTKSDWLMVSVGGHHYVGLESSGALWTTWENDDGGVPSHLSRRPSKYSDWIIALADQGRPTFARQINGFMVTEGEDVTWALARDGTLCCWADPEVSPNSFFRNSRRPFSVCNILDGK